MFVAKRYPLVFMPRAHLFRYGRLFELFIKNSLLFFFIIIDFDQIKLWFSEKRFSAIGRTYNIKYSFANTIHFQYYTIYLAD